MYILGINAYHADASACILKDGQLLAASEEERFTRVKHWIGFPVKAIEFCLKEAGITIEEVDHITIGRDPKAKFAKKVLYQLSSLRSIRSAGIRLKNNFQVANLKQQIVEGMGVDPGRLKAKFHNIEHHRSHLASAFFASPFDEAAILSIDGSGDFTTTMLAVGKGNKIKVLDSVDFPVSIGQFYTAFTQYLGFPYYGDEYKVMGLSPYGEPKYLKELDDVIFPIKNGLFSWGHKYFRGPKDGAVITYQNNMPVVPTLFSPALEAKLGPARKKGEDLTQYHKDLAASVQRKTEEIIFHLLDTLHKRTGLKKVCIAGGVAQNSVANGKVTSETPFDELYVPSAGHDAGISMGSAMYLYNHVLQMPRKAPVYNPYTGSHYTDEEVKKLLEGHNLKFTRLSEEELVEKVTEKLLGNAVVGWFQGRAEFGPRALGNRSILADPRNKDAQNLLNLKIKKRESFRPFAPSILEDHVAEFFEKNEPSPFMERVLKIKKEKHALIPAVTHVDGTGRLQTVKKEINPRYYNLISKFYEKTGVPILLNTSFNENEPIVDSPKQALDCFLRTNMDILVMENIIVERQ